MAAVERVELVRGPTSSLYGADSFLGVINVITKSGTDGGGRIRAMSTVDRNARFGAELSVQESYDLGPFVANTAISATWTDRGGVTESSPKLRRTTLEGDETTSPTNISGSLLHRFTYEASDTLNFGLLLHGVFIEREYEFAQQQLTTNTPGAEGTRLLYNTDASATVDWSFLKDLNFAGRATFATGSTTNRDQVDVGSGVYYVNRNLSYLAIDLDAEITWTPLPA